MNSSSPDEENVLNGAKNGEDITWSAVTGVTLKTFSFTEKDVGFSSGLHEELNNKYDEKAA